MPKPLFSATERPTAELLGELAYLNPFLPERSEREKQILGDDFRAPEYSRMNPARIRHLSLNTDKLTECGNALLEQARGRLARLESLSTHDQHTYQNVAYFLAYHRFVEQFDRFITHAHEAGQGTATARFYQAFCEELARHFPMTHRSKLPTGFAEAHIFSCCFQIRRAFLHIFRYIIGTSPAAMRLRARVWQSIFTHDMARYQRCLYDRMGDITTLITGPSGSGKELVARAIGLSRFIPLDPERQTFTEDFIQGFLPVNLSALSPTLIESELFGHRRGAFTGALQDRAGYFESCGQYGSVFLDEIGDTEAAIQVKLLRVLQTRQFQRLGDTQGRRFSGKIIAATNHPPHALLEAGSFREDFYFRLCADRIETPSLQEILAEDPTELDRLILHIAEKIIGPEAAVELMELASQRIHSSLGMRYPWPGNFRELEQCVRNVLVHGDYRPEHMAPSHNTARQLARDVESGTLTADDLLAQYTQLVYKQSHHNYEETARRLNVDRRTVKKYLGLDR